MASTRTPLGAVARGLLAGAAGTAVMTAAQTAYYKATGAEGSETPAEVGKKLAGLVDVEVPEERTEELNTAMHVAYGTGWGALYGLVAGSRPGRGPLKAGLLFSLAVWGASLVELPALGVAKPTFAYGLQATATDFGFHLVYGEAVALAYELVG